jgi:hypothetical protein
MDAEPYMNITADIQRIFCAKARREEYLNDKLLDIIIGLSFVDIEFKNKELILSLV